MYIKSAIPYLGNNFSTYPHLFRGEFPQKDVDIFLKNSPKKIPAGFEKKAFPKSQHNIVFFYPQFAALD